MDIDQIRTFVTISQLKSFSRAADTLHRSQPAISRRIELLSEELGARRCSSASMVPSRSPIPV